MAASDLKLRLTEIATCPICLEDFTQPKSLPCVHSFCLKCLEAHCKDLSPGQEVNCPLCRSEFKLPDTGVAGLPDNFVLRNLVEAKGCKGAKGVEGKVLCDVCMKEDVDDINDVPAATVYCVECSQNLCKPCSRPHKQWSGGPHQLKELDADGKTEVLQQRRSYCEKHEQKIMELYCFDCKTNMCTKCFAMSHTQHKCGEIEEVANEFAKRLDDDIKQIRERMCEFSSALAKTEMLCDNFRAVAEKVENEIVDRGEKMKQMVNQHVAELLQELHEVQSVNKKDTDARTDAFSLALVAMDSYAEYAMEIKSKGSHGDITTSAEKLHSQANELLQTYYTPGDYSPPSLTLAVFYNEQFVRSGQNIIGSLGNKVQEGPVTQSKKSEDDINKCHNCEEFRGRVQQLTDEVEYLKNSETQSVKLLHCGQSELAMLNTNSDKDGTLHIPEFSDSASPLTMLLSNEEVQRLRNIETQFQKLTQYASSGFNENIVINSDDEVRGITSLYGKMDVLRDANADQIDVYDMNANYREMSRRLSVPGDDLWDMTASTRRRCLYISEFVKKKVYRVPIRGFVTEWDLGDFEPRGLSLLPNDNLLVTCRGSTAALVELDGDGLIVNQIYLDVAVAQPWHTVKLSDGNFVVCHSGGRNKLHQVCIVDCCGQVIRSYGDCYGSDIGELNVPCHLAVDENDFIFVADCLNNRVTLFTPMLDFIDNVTKDMDSRPQRLYLDRVNGRLYIGQRSGNVIAVEL